jgi:hypothetical protein
MLTVSLYGREGYGRSLAGLYAAACSRSRVSTYRLSPGFLFFDTNVDVTRDFLPLITTMYRMRSGQGYDRLARGAVNEWILSTHIYPIGKRGYRTFKQYSKAAWKAGIVNLGACGLPGEGRDWIQSTGRLERACRSRLLSRLIVRKRC